MPAGISNWMTLDKHISRGWQSATVISFNTSRNCKSKHNRSA